ncbi:MAG TPA: hypothetical protein VEK82_16545 [Stellaceae bacterium]|nr:hypothetical protein [Stellaceae bacterium]
MAQTTTRWPSEAERQRIQKIIDRHSDERPEGVRRVTFRFGEDQAGDPAVYIEIYVDKETQPTKEKIEELNDFVQIILNDILDQDIDYWPYARTLVEE